MYAFMLNVQKSNNLILNSIVHCDIIPISSVETLATTPPPVLVENHIQTPHCGVFVLSNFLSCNMDVIYPQQSERLVETCMVYLVKGDCGFVCSSH